MQRHYYADPDLGTIELTDRITMVGWQSKENAEEGSTAMVSVVIDDPDLELDIVGHRKWFIVEDESEATDNIIFGGFVADQKIARSGGDWTEPFGRVWTVSLTDANAIWQRRVMVGSDCNRPEETDVARIQWLLATAEAALFDDVTTFVSTASPVAMDACDYRGQSFSQVADDCAQASGKNWWAQFIWDGADRNLTAWYGRDSLAVYDSDLFLTNRLTDVVIDDIRDGTSLVWPISRRDTELNRDPSRVFSGCYLEGDGVAVYRSDADTAAAFAKRDFVAPSLNVKSTAKASARALRYLADLDDQDVRITTSTVVPKGKATMLRSGMRVRFRAGHLPGFTSETWWQWCRVLNCAPEPVAAGERYRLNLELAPTGSQWAPPYTGELFAVVYDPSNGTGNGANRSNYCRFWSTGDEPGQGRPPNPKVGPIDYYADGDDVAGLIFTQDTVVDILATIGGQEVTTISGASVDYAVQLSGGTVAIASMDWPVPGYHSFSPTFGVDNLAVSAGDTLTVIVGWSNPLGWRVDPFAGCEMSVRAHT